MSNSPYVPVRNIMLLIIVINAIFLLTTRFLPFIDLPNHLAEATIYKYYGDGDNVITQYYTRTPWFYPNTFHTVFCSLFPSVEFGNVVFHIIYIALLQVSMFLVIRQLRGNPWYGLLGTLYTYNYNLTFGFVGYALSIPLTIMLFYVILTDMRKDTLTLKIVIALLLILLFLVHAQAALFGLVLYGLMTLYAYRRTFMKVIVRGVLVPLPLVILIFTWWFTRDQVKEESTLGFLRDYYTTRYIPNFIDRFRIAVFDNFQLREGASGVVIAVLFFLALLIPLVLGKVWRGRSIFNINSNVVYPFVFFIASVFCYGILPDELPGQSPLFQRFCTIVLLSFIILASVWMNNVQLRWLPYFTIFTIVIYTALWFEYIYTFNRVNKDFNSSLFESTSSKATLAGLIYDNKYRGRKVYIHYPNYFIIWKNGIAASKIIDYRFGVVRRAASEAELPFYHEYIGEPYKPRPVPEYDNVNYVLVRGDGPLQKDIDLNNFSLNKESGAWRLFKHR